MYRVIVSFAFWACACHARRIQGLSSESRALDQADDKLRYLQSLLFAVSDPVGFRNRVARTSSINGATSNTRNAAARMDTTTATLPSNAILEREIEEEVWAEEQLEYNGLLNDAETPAALQTYLQSYKDRDGTFVHAFDGTGDSLSEYEKLDDDDELCIVKNDIRRLRLIIGLLEAIDFLHDRGSAHLGLNQNVIRIAPLDQKKPDPDEVELRLIGLGAAVKLGRKGRTNFQLDESVSFHAPELLESPLVASDLTSLFLLDSWSTGVLVTMLAGGLRSSPFEAKADWTKGYLSDEKAVSERIKDIFSDFQNFLLQVEENSCGLIWRNAWVAKIIIGLLQRDPRKRLQVKEALAIATAAIQSVDSIDTYSSTLTETLDSDEQPNLAAEVAASLAASIASGELIINRNMSRYSYRNQYRKPEVKGKKGEPFRSFEAVLNILERGRSYVTMQNRSDIAEMQNYGELIGFRNKNDGERWDAFVPGQNKILPIGQPLRVKRVLGVILIPGGNHKLVVIPRSSKASTVSASIDNDIKAFCRAYTESHPEIDTSRVKYLEYEKIKI